MNIDIVYYTVPSVSAIATGAIHFIGGAVVAGGAMVFGGWVFFKVLSAIQSIIGHRAERPAVEE